MGATRVGVAGTVHGHGKVWLRSVVYIRQEGPI